MCTHIHTCYSLNITIKILKHFSCVELLPNISQKVFGLLTFTETQCSSESGPCSFLVSQMRFLRGAWLARTSVPVEPELKPRPLVFKYSTVFTVSPRLPTGPHSEGLLVKRMERKTEMQGLKAFLEFGGTEYQQTSAMSCSKSKKNSVHGEYSNCFKIYGYIL